jgi:hypothetical protein
VESARFARAILGWDWSARARLAAAPAAAKDPPARPGSRSRLAGGSGRLRIAVLAGGSRFSGRLLVMLVMLLLCSRRRLSRRCALGSRRGRGRSGGHGRRRSRRCRRRRRRTGLRQGRNGECGREGRCRQYRQDPFHIFQGLLFSRVSGSAPMAALFSLNIMPAACHRGKPPKGSIFGPLSRPPVSPMAQSVWDAPALVCRRTRAEAKVRARKAGRSPRAPA